MLSSPIAAVRTSLTQALFFNKKTPGRSPERLRKLQGDSRRQGLKFWISAWLPVAVGIAIIMLESTTWFGADHTSQPLRRLWEAVFGAVSNARWETHSFPDSQVRALFGLWVSRAAWLRAWWMTLPRSHFLEDAFLALLGTALVASLR